MNQTQRNLEIALEELELQRLENKHLQSKIKRLKDEIYYLNNPKIITKDDNRSQQLVHILENADQAMDRFTAKLRKENAKYAKQKQGKG